MRSLFYFVLIILSLKAEVFAYKEIIINVPKNSFSNNRPWIYMGVTEEESIIKLFGKLSKSQTGKKIIEMSKKTAKNQDKELLNIIKVGKISITDTTLIRKFSHSHPEKITYKEQTTVYINKDLPPMEATLDLAHELIHFSKRNPFNPYSQNFELNSFLQSMLEGKGGEVDAFLSECKVHSELIGNIKYLRSNCLDLINDKGEFDRQKLVKKFYRVGGHYEELIKKITKRGIDTKLFPHLSRKNALFISSAYGLPYPVAAYKEYIDIKNKTCQNDRKRLSLMGKTKTLLKGDPFLVSFYKRCNSLL